MSDSVKNMLNAINPKILLYLCQKKFKIRAQNKQEILSRLDQQQGLTILSMLAL